MLTIFFDSGNHFGEDGTTSLAQIGLSCLKNLSVLDIHYNHLTDASVIEIAKSAKLLTSIRHLKLMETSYGKGGARNSDEISDSARQMCHSLLPWMGSRLIV
jgi:hypothetical protein